MLGNDSQIIPINKNLLHGELGYLISLLGHKSLEVQQLQAKQKKSEAEIKFLVDLLKTQAAEKKDIETQNSKFKSEIAYMTTLLKSKSGEVAKA